MQRLIEMLLSLRKKQPPATKGLNHFMTKASTGERQEFYKKIMQEANADQLAVVEKYDRMLKEGKIRA